jgi:hypothetical protein
MARLFDNSGQTGSPFRSERTGRWAMALLKLVRQTGKDPNQSARNRSLSMQIRSPAAQIHGLTAPIQSRLWGED